MKSVLGKFLKQPGQILGLVGDDLALSRKLD